jgi:hypothetical protein
MAPGKNQGCRHAAAVDSGLPSTAIIDIDRRRPPIAIDFADTSPNSNISNNIAE